MKRTLLSTVLIGSLVLLLTSLITATPAKRPHGVMFDYDGDGRSDLSVYRPSDGRWYLRRSQLGELNFAFGLANDQLAPADYDGDGRTDVAVFRGEDDPDKADFFIMNSANGSVTAVSWGLPGDVPVVADYDGDGKADLSVWRASNGMWYTMKSTGGYDVRPFGRGGDVPLVMDVDADGQSDMSVFRPANGSWYTMTSSAAAFARNENAPVERRVFGAAGDVPVPADYDGDGKPDMAIYRAAQGTWTIAESTGKIRTIEFGLADDLPTPGDYDGDGMADIAVFRPSDGRWWMQLSGSDTMVVQYGLPGDKPTPNAFVH